MIAPKPLPFIVRKSTFQKPSQRLERKYMTIAAGFVCRDGIVLGADTAESYGETKTYVNKIAMANSGVGLCAVAGSGDAYLIDFMVPQIQELFMQEWHGAKNAHSHLQHLMTKIYTSPEIDAYPAEKPESKIVQLLVAFHPHQGQPVLFSANASLVVQVKHGACVIGCGPLRDVADDLAKLRPGVDVSAWAVLYLIHLAKKRYSDVGGLSHILKMTNDGKWEDQLTFDQHRREKFFSAFSALTNLLMLYLTDNDSNSAQLDMRLKRVVRECKGLRKQLVKIEQEYKWTKLGHDLRLSHGKVKKLSREMAAGE